MKGIKLTRKRKRQLTVYTGIQIVC
jgi:hypothetical protein